MTRPPPESKKQKFIDEINRFAMDDIYGYSQKPPSGRWGPDFDCSSLIYQAASNAGYSVGHGGERVRFTGTMLKDFEKAGFQILPFANVGISDLRIGDILLNLALHAEVYVGEGESVGATGSENGTFVGEAGDQTGREIEKHPVTLFNKGWDYILRPPDDEEETEEGDDDMPMNYMPPMNNGWPQPTNQMYPMNNGYPQGNLGQMNGYSQANAYMRAPYAVHNGMNGMNGVNNPNGYPQGQAENDLIFVMGIEGAKNYRGTPNSRMALFDEDKPLMYVVGFDQNGCCNDIHVYEFNECSEDMPQHLSPLMHHGQQMQMPQMDNYITREEFNQLKEMLENAKPTMEPPNATRNVQPTTPASGSRNRT